MSSTNDDYPDADVAGVPFGVHITPSGTTINPRVWPAPVDIDGIVEETLPVLSKKQRRRAAALSEARFALESRGGPFGGGTSSRPPSCVDLLVAAQWILDGE